MTHPLQKFHQLSLALLAMTPLLASLLAMATIAGSVLDVFFGDGFPAAFVHVSMVCLGMVLAILVASLRHVMDGDGSWLDVYVGGLASAVVAAAKFGLLAGALSETPAFVLVTMAGAAFTYSAVHFGLSLLRFGGGWPARFAAGAALLHALPLAFSVFDNLTARRDLLLATEVIRMGLLALLPALALATIYYIPGFETKPGHFRQSALMRLVKPLPTQVTLRIFYGLAGAGLVQLLGLWYDVVFGYHGLDARAPAQLPLAGMEWALFPWLFHVHGNFLRSTDRLRENQMVSFLTADHVKRFLRRYRAKGDFWAATIGIRTVSFTVDHDPEGMVAGCLPASMIQIRREEIERCVLKVAGPQLLLRQNNGNQILGVMDAEVSLRPCVEALLLFTAIYLDAAPLVERRLKGLIMLFPVIDPGLARVLASEKVAESLSRGNWIFYLEYDWVDQQLINAPGQIRYGVHVAGLGGIMRQRMLEHLRAKNYLGNFIWIGEKARERLLLEAPYLAGVIEAHPISLNDDDEDAVVFLIKFEELIPRMQKYFNLDESRKILNDYEPSMESRSLLKVMDFHLSQAKKLDDAREVMQTLANFAWSGFKEKDMALRMVLKAYNLGASLCFDEQAEDFRHECLAAVIQIGYPSQVLHDAEMKKRQVRDPKQIRQIATDPNHERFHDAWLFLATTDTSRYALTDIQHCLGLIMEAVRDKRLQALPIVKGKAIEAYFNFARRLPESEASFLVPHLNELATFVVRTNAPPDYCCFFLDALVFLEEHFRTSFKLNELSLAMLQTHFANLYESLGGGSSPMASLTNRWKLFMKTDRNRAA